MEQTTRDQLVSQVNHIAIIAKRIGIMAPGDQLVLRTGGSVVGVQVWLMAAGESGYRHAPITPSGGIVGMTKREAARTLDAIAQTLVSVEAVSR